MTADSDRLTAYLAQVRARSEQPVARVTSLPISHPGVRGLMESAGDVPALVAALEAVLALTGEWRDTAADLDRRAGVAADEGDSTKSALLSYRAQAHTDCAARLERAISAALPGTGK